MEKEIWKDIEGYDGAYQVSNRGNVFVRVSYVVGYGGKALKKPHILKSADNGRGYRYVTISVNNRRKNHYVHILVARAFIQNTENKPIVNHKNGIKSDNRVENLEWCTYAENNQHAILTGLTRKGCDKVNAIKILHQPSGNIYGTIKEAAKTFGLNYGTLKDGLKRKQPYKGLCFASHPIAAKQLGLSESRLK